MIGIKVNDEFLDLLPDTSINLKLASPIFADGNIIRGSFSLPFDIPFGDKSERNSLILDHYDVINNVSAQKKVDASLFLDGNFYKEGKLVLGKVADDLLSANFQFGLATLSEDLKEMKVNESVSYQVTLASNTYTKKCQFRARTDLFTGPFKVVVNGKEYTGNTNQELVTAINANTDEPRAVATYYATGYVGGGLDYMELQPESNPDDVFTPFTIGLPPTEDYARYSLNADDFIGEYNDPIKATLDTYIDPAPPDDVFRFPLVKNAYLYDGEKVKYQYGINPFPYQNFTQNGAMILNKPVDFYFSGNPYFGASNRNSVTPMVRLEWLLQQLATQLDTSLEGDFLDSEDVQKAILYNTNTLEDRIPFGDNLEWLATRRIINASDHLPEMKVTDLFKELQKRYNLAVYVNDKTGKIRMAFRDAIIQDPDYKDITALVSPRNEMDSEQLTGLRLEAKKDDKDQLQPDDFFQLGEVEKTIPTEFSGLNAQISEKPLFSSLSFEIPEAASTRDTKAPLRIIFYQGITTVSFSSYAHASIHPDPDLVNPVNVFFFDGVNGQYERRWKKYFQFLLARRSASFSMELDLPDLLDLDWEKKVMVDGVRYLINTLDVTLTMQGIQPANIQLYTV